MIGSFWITGIFAHVPAVGIPEGIEASSPDDAPLSCDPEEEPLPELDELPLLLPEEEEDDELPPLEEPLLEPELPDDDPLPLPDASVSLEVEPSSDVGPLPTDPVVEEESHEALKAIPANAANPAERKTVALMLSS
jgi:hypothetical protein